MHPSPLFISHNVSAHLTSVQTDNVFYIYNGSKNKTTNQNKKLKDNIFNFFFLKAVQHSINMYLCYLFDIYIGRRTELFRTNSELRRVLFFGSRRLRKTFFTLKSEDFKTLRDYFYLIVFNPKTSPR